MNFFLLIIDFELILSTELRRTWWYSFTSVIFILHPKKRVYPFLAFLLHWNSLLIRIKPSFGYNKKLCPIKGVFYTLLWKYFYTFLRVFDFFVHSFFLFFFSKKNPHRCTRVKSVSWISQILINSKKVNRSSLLRIKNQKFKLYNHFLIISKKKF